jgi:hypothetical protein
MIGFVSAFTSIALCNEIAIAKPSTRVPALTWIEMQQEMARALKQGDLSPQNWMVEVERLAKQIDVQQLMSEVNASKVTAVALPVTNDPIKRSVRFIDATGAPRRLGYASALFDFSPTNVITPHGHKHMVSAHLIVSGRLRVRNFDRISDRTDAMQIRPTRDYVASTGSISTMSSERDNVHWFVPVGGPAQTFDTIISGLDDGQPDYDIVAIDPAGGKRMQDGTIWAKFMDFEAASAKYTTRL